MSIPNSRSPTPDPLIDAEHRASRVESDRERDQAEREPDHDDEHARDHVERALQRPVPARQDRRTKVEEQHSEAGNVLALLHEQLGRVGSESSLHPRSVCALDTVLSLDTVYKETTMNVLSRLFNTDQTTDSVIGSGQFARSIITQSSSSSFSFTANSVNCVTQTFTVGTTKKVQGRQLYRRR